MNAAASITGLEMSNINDTISPVCLMCLEKQSKCACTKQERRKAQERRNYANLVLQTFDRFSATEHADSRDDLANKRAELREKSRRSI